MTESNLSKSYELAVISMAYFFTEQSVNHFRENKGYRNVETGRRCVFPL